MTTGTHGYIKNSYIGFIVCCLLTTEGCLDTTIIGIEFNSNSSSDDTETDVETDSYIDTESNNIPDDDTDSSSDFETDSIETCDVPTDFKWISSEPLIYPAADSTSIKDPSVVYYNGLWHIYATSITTETLTMNYVSFSDWDEVGAAEKIPVNTNENLTGYKAAPQIFYFKPQNLWYLVYQIQDPAYSTTEDPSDVSSWSAMKTFMPMPEILTSSDYMGIDFWIICDDTDCYLFFSALNGILYRARTAKEDFPNGFEGTTEIVMEENQYDLYDACNVYKMAGTDQYLLLVSAIGGSGRYFRSWTSDRLDGEWTKLADTESNPFASMSNVTGAEWSAFGISHGEMLRSNPDESMTINTCDMKYLYSGLFVEENTDTDYYALGLLSDARKK